MIPTYIIHNTACEDRKETIKNLIEKTNGEIVEAIYLENRLLGCCLSHLKVAHLSKKLYPNAPYLVLEDDCVLHPGWDEALSDLTGEVIYLGYNNKHSTGVLFGTHAMFVSPIARDYLIEKLEKKIKSTSFPAYDWLCWQLWVEGQIEVGYPEKKDKYCEQAKGLKSTITGNIR